MADGRDDSTGDEAPADGTVFTRDRFRRGGDGLEFDRVANFADAIYAIALTLVVVGIGVPELDPWVRARLRTIGVLAMGALGLWALWALLGERPDWLGAFWFACLVAFWRWGPSREVYVGAAVVVTWLEIVGTSLGTWAWQTHDPILGIPIGNPPTGAAGGYGWFDLLALLVAPWILARVTRGRRPGRR